ncbi:LysR family transcriptional regulator [Bradyrhizobium iriomotense]|uniref:LysR family transcriptional regulator n=1 Tax=Bradyrhizobium iriomotense TaxID=441950 RepID=UPI001B89FDD1|nr:LysR family transcriptional regulator [Bradyrhizobium iriomotense]
MTRFRELEAFILTVERGSQTSAAAALGMSRMAVSRLVSQLEERTGRPLLTRTTRSQLLTEAGERLLREAKNILDSYDRALCDGLDTHRSKIRVGAPISFGLRRLMPILRQFSAMYPEIEIELMLSDRLANLAEEGLDIAVRISNRHDQALSTRFLTHSRTVICAAPSYLNQLGMPKIPIDLTKHNCLRYTSAEHGHDWVLRDADGKAHRVPIKGSLSCNNGDALVAAAVAGTGLVLQPYFLVADELADGRLVQLLSSYKTKQFSVQLVTIPTARPRADIAKLSDFLFEAMRPAKY